MAGIDANCIWIDHCDGTTTSFVDSSQYVRTVTATGNATQSNAQAKFGGKSALFDGVADMVSIADTSALDVGTGDFTTDAWVYFTDLSAGLFRFFEWGDYSTAGWLAQVSSPVFQVYVNNTPRNWTWSPSINTWYHLAIERYSGNLYAYVDGTKLGAGQACTENISGSTGGASYGDSHTLIASSHKGHIDEPRWSDIGRYAGTNFTAPTAAYSTASSVNSNFSLFMGG